MHHIETADPPVALRLRRLPPDHSWVTKQEFQQMLDLEIIRPSGSSWSSPLHLVSKKETNGWQACGDFRDLNKATVAHTCPILEGLF